MIGAGKKMVKRKRFLFDGGRNSTGEVRKVEGGKSMLPVKRQRLAVLQSWEVDVVSCNTKGGKSSGSSLETNAMATWQLY